MVFICISLITSNVEHLFMCVLAIWRNVYSGLLPIFFEWAVCFDAVKCRKLSILKANPLSVISFANIFPRYMVYFFKKMCLNILDPQALLEKKLIAGLGQQKYKQF